MSYECRHVSVSIDCPSERVYEFVSNPENVPKWAAGLGGSIRRVNGDWIATSPMGEVKIKFADENTFGVLDHVVTLPSGERVNNPMRVVPNENGSEVMFTLFRRPAMTEQMFAEDAAAVTRDLETLKRLLEQ
jgi:hypothetical protein